MIKTFTTKETAALFANKKVKRLPPEITQVARRKLARLHRISSVDELRIPPDNRLEKLSHDRNDQWRICFRFEVGDAFEVEITDYH